MSNFAEAAFKVLEQAGKPLHYREITRQALRDGLIARTVKTPAAALHAHLAVDILAYGHVSRFQRLGDGTFALRVWGLPESPTTPRAHRVRKKQVLPAPHPPQPALPPTKPLLEVIEGVLRESPNSGPLAADEIITKARAKGWLSSGMLPTPGTVTAAITSDNRRRVEQGGAPRFLAHGLGNYSLAAADKEHAEVEAHNSAVRRELLQRLQTLAPSEFASLVQDVLQTMGFTRVSIIQMGAQGQVQLMGEFMIAGALRTEVIIHTYPGNTRQNMGVVKTIRQALKPFSQGLVVAAGDFSLIACSEAVRPDSQPIGLISGYDLVALMTSCEIGVRQSAEGRLILSEEPRR